MVIEEDSATKLKMEESGEVELKKEENCEVKKKIGEDCEAKLKMEKDRKVKLKMEEDNAENLKVHESGAVELKEDEDCEVKIKSREDREAKLKMEEDSKVKEDSGDLVKLEEYSEGQMEDGCEETKTIEEDSEVKTEIEQFLCKKYVMVKQEHFEDYLQFLGKGYMARKAALSLHPEVWLTRNEETYTFSFHSILASYDVTFTPGEEFDEVKPDGKVKSVITLDGNKMIHLQTEDSGRVSKHVREFHHDRMITITTAEGLDKTVIRYYELVQ